MSWLQMGWEPRHLLELAAFLPIRLYPLRVKEISFGYDCESGYGDGGVPWDRLCFVKETYVSCPFYHPHYQSSLTSVYFLSFLSLYRAYLCHVPSLSLLSSSLSSLYADDVPPLKSHLRKLIMSVSALTFCEILILV